VCPDGRRPVPADAFPRHLHVVVEHVHIHQGAKYGRQVAEGTEGTWVIGSKFPLPSRESVLDQLKGGSILAAQVMGVGDFCCGGQGVSVIGTDAYPPLIVETLHERHCRGCIAAAQ